MKLLIRNKWKCAGTYSLNMDVFGLFLNLSDKGKCNVNSWNETAVVSINISPISISSSDSKNIRYTEHG